MPSFDVQSEIDIHELTNAVDQASRELETRFDFRGTKCRFEHAKEVVTLVAEADFQLKQLLDILNQTLLALATFAGNAASLSCPEWRIDGKAVTAELKLASLAQRLARGGGGAAKPAAQSCDQSYELFADG